MMRIVIRAGLAGIGFFVLLFAFIVMPCFDAHAQDYPTVVAVTPADGAVRVPIDTTIVIQFSKQMDTDDVEDNVKIGDQFLNRIQGTFYWSATVYQNDTVTFTPTQNLGYSLSYEVIIEASCRDIEFHHPLNGYEGEEERSYFATVGAPGDDSAPEVMTVGPYNGQVGGDIPFMAALFTKPIDPATATSLNVILSGPGISGYSVNCEYKPCPIVIIEPDTLLTPHSDYTVTLTTGLTDTEGHALASQYTWSFNTGAGDTTSPTVTQTVPANGALYTRPYAQLKVYFSENMDPDSINNSTVTVYDETAHVYKDIHINKRGVDENGNRSRIHLMPVFEERNWSVGHTYTVSVSQTVSDLSENALGSDYNFTFTVADYPDFAPDVYDDDDESVGIRQPDGSTMIDLEVDAIGAHGPDNLTMVATDLTQPGKSWTLTNDPGENDFHYNSTGDEGLDTGYHEIEFLCTDTVNGLSTSLRWNFYVFNATPSLVAPMDHTRDISTTPWLQWNTNGLVNVDMYIIVILDGPDIGSANFVWTSFLLADESSNYSVKVPACHALSPNTTYYWAVVALDNHYWFQGRAFSPIWSFTTGKDEIAVDFGANGLWHYDGTGWSSLAGWNPDGNMVEWDNGFVVDFGSYGLWNHDGSYWTSLAGWDPADMASYNTGLAVDFETYGLWYHDGSYWTSLAGWNPEGNMVAWTGGLAVDFGASYGLWNYDGSTWTSLAGWNPNGLEAYSTGLAVDFDTHGLWYYDGTGWTSLAGWNPEGMKAWGTSIAVDFGNYGLWNYDGSSWSSLAGWDPDDMETYHTGLAVDFDNYGLWYYNGTSWTSLAGWNPEGMKTWLSGLAVDFGTYGLWNYDGSTWTSLAGWNPEDMIDVDLY